jgi:hypothetical protein
VGGLARPQGSLFIATSTPFLKIKIKSRGGRSLNIRSRAKIKTVRGGGALLGPIYKFTR